jgi:HJR/Mrr/RecB family endonuclease
MSYADRNVYYAKNISIDLGASKGWHDERRKRRGDRWLIERYDEHLGTDWVVLTPGERAKPQPKIMTRGQCLYCSSPLQFFGQPDNEPFVGDQSFAGECQICGWWFCQSQRVRDAEGLYDGGEYHEGILSELDISALDLPVQILTSHLRTKFEDVRSVHPRTFELLCESILSEHFDCEVRLTGYSKDKGVDLYLIRGEVTRAVQLKRRGKPISEGVAPAREFLGAMVENEIQTGVFISTAQRFTRGAQKLASSPVLRSQGINIELIDAHGLEEIFDRRGLMDKPWKRIASIKPPRIIFPPNKGREPRFPW